VSVILAVAGGTSTPDDAAVRRALGAMHAGADDRVAIWRGAGVLLAVARQPWELSPAIAGDALVVIDGDLAIAADASIYYRAELRAALERAGVAPTGSSASHLILAAYRAWGDECAAHLEGDFAFAIWNGAERRISAARDLSGKRTLHHATVNGALVLASTIGGAIALPGASSALNLTVIAETAAGLWGGSAETCYESVRVLPAGWTLSQGSGAPPRLRRHWSPPRASTRGALAFDDAAAELRALLTRAVTERLDSHGDTSIWLSGGWDSPAVFAAGANVLASDGSGRALRPVSISYPEGDPGREDELIRDIAARWSAPVHWIDIQNIPFFDRPEERAAARDEPFAHPFEMWHRSLARGSRATGARIALEGVGGDQLFQVSEVYFADLLRTGRWAELAREWRAKGMTGSGFRNFFRWAIQPNLPRPALAVARLLRGGRPLVGYLERTLPPWIDRGFARQHELDSRDRAHTPRPPRGSRADQEMNWYLSHQYFPRVFGCVFAFALSQGVEIRSPLYDRRVIEFALTRPRTERSAGTETKRLLRAAMKGLLPESVLGPRTARTGVTGGYFARSMRAQLPAMLKEVGERPLLAQAGVIDAMAFHRAALDYARGVESEHAVPLYFTLQTELWLRAHIVGGVLALPATGAAIEAAV
jgi:asparagine synthase (glutamine-hydrolysing)